MRQAARAGGIGEEAIQHHRQATGGRPEDHPGHAHQIVTPHLRQDIQPVRRVRLIMGYRPGAPPPPYGPAAPAADWPPQPTTASGSLPVRTLIVAAAGVVLAIPNSPTPKAFTPSAASWRVRCMLASSTVSGLLAAHRRRPGDIPATAGHFEVNQAGSGSASMPTSTTCTLAPACAASTQTPVLPRTILPA
ncbi:Uncharacterised protein [Klebsiella pneumoniae subsp. rhinoscleromatis]|nr:Uncharacterised protein [Klebsiella pneumoniae subsp. rhinoscleromatis]